jgi:hypothetical protein
MLAQGRHPLPDMPATSSRASSQPKVPQHHSLDASASFHRTSYYPNQQQLAPPVVSTVPVPAPVSLVPTPSQSQSPAPSPLSPFPTHGQGWLMAGEDNVIC